MCNRLSSQRMKRFVALLLLVTVFLTASGQRKFEFRAAWIASVANIDWPSAGGISTEQQRQEMVGLLDSLQKLNFNAVVFQVRPTADALYKSEIEPWSFYLTGSQDSTPKPFYDPLAFTIYEAHKRNIDVHVWINPYRILNDADVSRLSRNHIFFKKPYMVVKYGGKYYFNPGLDETRNYLVRVISDIVRRYDMDAIHFDDYFYPYRVAGEDFPDSETFSENPRGFDDIGDWRRNNVNMVIRELSTMIHQTKPWVEFGISPFGVWRNVYRDPAGSNTKAGTTNYDDLYADVRLWLQNGWIDYVAPQLYWEIGKQVADYSVLIDWWNRNTFGKNLYIGLYASGLTINKAEAWKRPNELCRQLRLNERYNNVKGDIMYSCRPLLRNPQGLCDSLACTFYKYPALIPPNDGMGGARPEAPQNLRVLKMGMRDYLWWDESNLRGGQKITSYMVYRFEKDEKVDLMRIDKVVARVQDNCLDLSSIDGKDCQIVVTAVNRYHYESEGSKPVQL